MTFSLPFVLVLALIMFLLGLLSPLLVMIYFVTSAKI